MKLQGDYLFDAPVDEVWKALFDPVVLAAVMPGCEKLDLVDGAYVGDLNIKVGPVQGKFSGKVDLKDIDEPRSYTMIVDGRGAPGFVKATASVKLEAEGTMQTRIRYDADAQVGGKIASVGERLLEASSRAITKQSLDGLHANVKLRFAAKEQDAEVAPVPAPDVVVAEENAVAAKAPAAKAPAAKAPAAVADATPAAVADATPAAASTEAAVDADPFGKAEVLSEATASTGGDASLEAAEIIPAPPPSPALAVPPVLLAKKPAAPVAVVKVDQNALAASIAKEVTKSLIPKPVAIGLAVVVAVIVIWLLAR